MTVSDEPRAPKYLLDELGFATRTAGRELHGTAAVTPAMRVPGTPHLRTSILAAWADTLTGLLATQVTTPRVPVTLDLDVQLYRPAPGDGTVQGTARVVKVGRSVFAAEVEFTSSGGGPLAIANASFMTAPDARLRLPPGFSVELPASREPLAVPFAERAGCERRGPGVAVLPRTEDGLNASGTVNGGLLALVAEEAALSPAQGETLCSLGLRYLQPARVGPVIATAVRRDGLGRVELRDSGNGGRLSCIAVTRTFQGGSG
ncbi:hotdog domain-containing protein [Actinomadura sp. KC345]|uniref:PaaI family thioesterase n=1 Tax=Actinomadura sp. KC345 TaxID=2530371 RepID=UPI001A9D143F|nr:hotdog domain-containing protein [Actinomadura sp. KC345]